ncbi:hypothetical protein N9924_00125 [bacterium]|nr:hypothetical protein [bacterium]
MSKFKESKFGKFLDKAGGVIQKNGGSILDIAIKAATGNVSGALQEVSGLLQGEDSEEAKALFTEFELKRKEFELEEKKLIIADRDSARDMQAAALSQDDLFSKRFVYYLASAVFAFSAIVVIMLFFVTIPEQNQRIVDMVLGVIIGSGLVSVLNFFYGASPEK